jgi:hypothetical protein
VQIPPSAARFGSSSRKNEDSSYLQRALVTRCYPEPYAIRASAAVGNLATPSCVVKPSRFAAEDGSAGVATSDRE